MFPNTIFSIMRQCRQAAPSVMEGAMETNHEAKHKHGHMVWVGFLGLAAGAALMIYVPSLKAISSAIVLFAAFHLVGAVVLLASVYVMGGSRIARRFKRGS